MARPLNDALQGLSDAFTLSTSALAIFEQALGEPQPADRPDWWRNLTPYQRQRVTSELRKALAALSTAGKLIKTKGSQPARPVGRMTRLIRCPACEGTGARPPHPSVEPQPCLNCRGRGRVPQHLEVRL